jgi:hypothetical protein
MPRVRYNKLRCCCHGHILVPDNLIRHGTRLVCRTCNIQACARWYARKQSRAVLQAEEP